MAFPIQQAVIDFHRKYGHPVRDTPQTITEGEAIQAHSFIEEETNELFDALYPKLPCDCPCADGSMCADYVYGDYDPDLIEIADALGDIVFTAYGKAIRHGIDLDRVLAAICESNMTKTANGMGKIKKTKGVYVPPKIAEALAV